MNREKLRDRVERQTAQDNARMRRWSRRREEKIVRNMDDPFAALLGRVGIVSMLASAFMIMTGELHRTGLTRHGLNSAVAGGLLGWGVSSLIVIPCMLLQLRAGFEHPYYKRRAVDRKGRLRTPPEKRCKRWIAVSALGLIVLAVLYAFTV